MGKTKRKELDKHKTAVENLLDAIAGECDHCPIESYCRGLLEKDECKGELLRWAYKEGK